ncbi:MAG: hypothetical protein KGZ81_12540 [Flavobacteriales bacterium]|nr:hypothetical protein [Flavobacteriales bacterium]
MGKRVEHWTGRIKSLKKYGSNYEIRIESRSSILVILGEVSSGYFACMPDFHAGCYLVDLSDGFWNREQLMRALGKVDGITVAAALEILSETRALA